MISSLNVPLLVDSGVLYALFDKSDAHHLRAVEYFRENQRHKGVAKGGGFWRGVPKPRFS